MPSMPLSNLAPNRPSSTMAAVAQATTNEITLRGSTAIVAEFFGYSINSILYQRGIYPPDQFVHKQQYGLSMLVTQDQDLKDYLDKVLTQLSRTYRWGGEGGRREARREERGGESSRGAMRGEANGSGEWDGVGGCSVRVLLGYLLPSFLPPYSLLPLCSLG